METTMTINAALKMGYTRCNEPGSERCPYISNMEKEDFDSTIFYVLDNEPSHYSINTGELIGLLDRQIEEQEEIYDEDGKLVGLLFDKEGELKKAVEIINNIFKGANWYYPTDVQLLPNSKED